MEISIEKVELFLKPVGEIHTDYKLTMKGEEQPDGSLLVHFCAVRESGDLIPLRWDSDVELDESP